MSNAVRQNDESLFAMARDFISMMKEKDPSLPLDFSAESLEFCQWFLSTLKDVDDAAYKNRVYISMAVYLGDYMIHRGGSDFKLSAARAESGQLRGIVISNNDKKFNMLDIVIKASNNPDSDNLVAKMAYFDNYMLAN